MASLVFYRAADIVQTGPVPTLAIIHSKLDMQGTGHRQLPRQVACAEAGQGKSHQNLFDKTGIRQCENEDFALYSTEVFTDCISPTFFPLYLIITLGPTIPKYYFPHAPTGENGG